MPAWMSYDMMTLIVFLALVAFAAYFGGLWEAGDWYRSLCKPRWTPPNWLFPVVWTLLYTLIAIAGLLVWNTADENRTLLVTLWGAQLILNALWSYIFFGRRDMRLALFDIALLWVAIASFIGFAWRANELAAILFLPYLAWVSYATALNAAILRLNPQEARAAM